VGGSQLAVQVLRLLSRRRSDGTIADRDQDLTTLIVPQLDREPTV
jgi:hypothetical protein